MTVLLHTPVDSGMVTLQAAPQPLTVQKTNSKIYNNLGDGTDNTLRIGPFASYQWDNFFIDTAPTVALHILKTNRNISFLGTAAKGERTGFDFDWMNTVGYKFDLPKGFSLTPSYGLAFTAFYDPTYTETGATNGANLRVEGHTSYSLLQNLDLKVGRLFKINDKLSLMQEVWVGWEHEYLGSGSEVTSAFAAAPSQSCTTTIATIAADRAVFGAAMTALVNDNTSIFGRYDQKVWDKGYETSFSLGIKISF